MSFSDDMTLGAAREKLRLLVNDGARCPCCAQWAQVWPRKVNSTMARDLIAMWRLHKREWCYLPDVRKASGSRSNREESKLRYWGLIEEDPVRREDAGRAGWWRVTEAGERWLLRQSTIPKYARIYDSRFLGSHGKAVTIDDALGTRFRYDDLMAGL